MTTSEQIQYLLDKLKRIQDLIPSNLSTFTHDRGFVNLANELKTLIKEAYDPFRKSKDNPDSGE